MDIGLELDPVSSPAKLSRLSFWRNRPAEGLRVTCPVVSLLWPLTSGVLVGLQEETVPPPPRHPEGHFLVLHQADCSTQSLGAPAPCYHCNGCHGNIDLQASVLYLPTHGSGYGPERLNLGNAPMFDFLPNFCAEICVEFGSTLSSDVTAVLIGRFIYTEVWATTQPQQVGSLILSLSSWGGRG